MWVATEVKFETFVQNLNSKLNVTPNDIEEITCPWNPNEKVNMCKQCGGKSGITDPTIDHDYKCQHYKDPYDTGNKIYQNSKKQLLQSQKVMKLEQSEGILPREYGIIDEKSSKKFIGTNSLFTCIAVCLRDRNTKKTILVHMDGQTDYVAFFQIAMDELRGKRNSNP